MAKVEMVSKCHHAPVYTLGVVTQFSVCTECGRACDAMPKSEVEPDRLVNIQFSYQVKIPQDSLEIRNFVMTALHKGWLWIDEIEEQFPKPQQLPGQQVRWDYDDKEKAYIDYVSNHWTDRTWAIFIVEVSHGGNLEFMVQLCDIGVNPAEESLGM